jgi:hypothetical protein
VHIEVNWFENIHQMQDFSFPKYILKYHKKWRPLQDDEKTEVKTGHSKYPDFRVDMMVKIMLFWDAI